MNHRMILLAAFITCIVPSARSIAGDVPPRTASGQTLVVSEAERDLGETYFVLPGVGTQLTWKSDAALFRLDAVCNRVVGYFVAPFELEEGTPPLLAGGLRAPTASLSTGAEQSDAGLHGAPVLNLAEYPEILISFVSAGPARNVSKENNTEQCEFDLVGELTVKDKTVRFESSARLALLPYSIAMSQFSPSDLLMVRTKFSVALADLGISTESPLGEGFAGADVEIELYFMCATLDPDKNLDPRVKDEHYLKQLQFMTRLRDFNDPKDAYAFGREFMEEIWDNSQLLNELASNVLTDEHVKRRDFAFAEKAAARAVELTERKDPTRLHTLARLYYERGELAKAIEIQKEAVDNLEGQPFYIPPMIRGALREYEAEAPAARATTEEPPEAPAE